MKIYFCRNCKSCDLRKLFSLGNLSFSGIFPKNITTDVPKAKLNLVICNNCKLVQIDKNFSLKYLYGNSYGYRTGINKTMTTHVMKTVATINKLLKIRANDHVLDIASNDGTLLNFYKNYNKHSVTVGIDPLINKYLKFYKKINYKISNFFNITDIRKLKLKRKFKAITALSVFYDLRNPNSFFRDICKILDKNGLLVLEHADLYCIIKKNIFDTICHEHLGFYSTTVLKKMIENNNLKLIKHEFNDINGGSSRYYIGHKNSDFKPDKSVKLILKKEKKLGLHLIRTFKIFFKSILKQKKKLNKIIKEIKIKKKIIHGYGASTKGNILLQFYKIKNSQIKFIADRNPQKYGCYTPGTKIKIISENTSRNLKPDYYLVLPWHFEKEIILREYKIKKSGTKFIFPLPKVKII